MEVIHFQDPENFQKDISGTLMRHEAENTLVLGVLANLIAGEYSDIQPYMAIYQGDGEIQAAALCTPPWPVLVSYVDPPPGSKILKSILADMEKTLQDDFTGLTGNREFVSSLVSQWEEETGKEALLKMAMRIYKLEKVLPVRGVPGKTRWVKVAMRIYKLEKVLPVRGVPGKTRWVKDKDKNLVEEWYLGFSRETGEGEPDQKHIQKQVKAYLTAHPKQRGLMIWEVEGRPVSMAGYAGPHTPWNQDWSGLHTTKFA
jgi:hypothetical protein